MPSVMRTCLVAFSVILMSIVYVTADKKNGESEKKKYLDASFDIIDTNKDGKISLHELKEFYKKAGLNDKQIELMFKAADADGDGEINKAEYVKSFGDKNFLKGENEDILKSLFENIDSNKDGYITVEELYNQYDKLGLHYSKEEIAKSFKKINKAGNGKINFEEFKEGGD